MTRHMSGEYISVSNGKRPVSNVKKRAKMFAVCAWMQIAVTPNDTLRSRTYSLLSILQKRFYPYSFAALCTPSYDARKRMLHDCNSIHRKSLLSKIRFAMMDNLLVAKEITRICKRFTAYIALIRHVYISRVRVK